MNKEMAKYQIEKHIECLKQEGCEFNQGFVTGMIMAYYYADLFSQNEVNQILSDNGLDAIVWAEEEEDSEE